MKNGVESIQAAVYNGKCTVCKDCEHKIIKIAKSNVLYQISLFQDPKNKCLFKGI